VGGQLGQSGKGIASFEKKALAGVLAGIQLSVRIGAAFMGEVCGFEELSKNHWGRGVLEIAGGRCEP
jgi:hypothetical protein